MECLQKPKNKSASSPFVAKLFLVLLFITTHLTKPTDALKILMAGDFTHEQRPFYENIAASLAREGHAVYFLTRDIDPVFKKKLDGGPEYLVYYGLGRHPDKFVRDPSKPELSEQYRLDLETL